MHIRWYMTLLKRDSVENETRKTSVMGSEPMLLPQTPGNSEGRVERADKSRKLNGRRHGSRG